MSLIDTVVTIAEGKYTLVLHADYRFECLRYDTPWRELTGDGLVFGLFTEVRALRSILSRLADNEGYSGDDMQEARKIVSEFTK